MNKQILTDLGGVLVSDTFGKAELIKDFAKYGEEYLRTNFELLAGQGDSSYIVPNELKDILERVREQTGTENPAEIMEIVLREFAQKRLDPVYLGLVGLVNIFSLGQGNFQIPFFEDTTGLLERCASADTPFSTYSKGSVDWQEAMFTGSFSRDLLSRIRRSYFDTLAIGTKTERDSYKKIADILKTSPSGVLYFSDDPKELDAADSAGMGVCLVDRKGSSIETSYKLISSFDQL